MIPSNCFYIDRAMSAEIIRSKLYGYAYTDEALIFGSTGYDLYEKSSKSREIPSEGRFAGVFVTGDSVLIKADATGQETLFLYRDGLDWAVSNSFMLLLSKVRTRATVTLYEPAAMSFHLKEGRHLGEQLVSHKTMVDEIKMLPLGHELIIDRRTGDLKIREREFLSTYSMGAQMSYEDLLRNFMERSAGLLRALATQKTSMNLSLSGGYDSRLVLALSLMAGNTRGLRVTSLTSKPLDFKVAKALSERFDLALNQAPESRTPRTLSASDSIRLYLLSCGGVYLPYYPVTRHRLSREPELHLTGDQPSGLSFLAGKARFNGEIAKIADDIGDALEDRAYGNEVRSDFLSTFVDLGIDSDHPAAPLAFYSAIRARHHGGRSWYKSLGDSALFTPLMHSDLMRLDIANATAGYRNSESGYGSKQKFFADAFSAVGGWALEEPFETPQRAFPSALLGSSPFRGGVGMTPTNLDVYGSVGDIDDGDADGAATHDFNLDLWDGVSGVKRHLLTLAKKAQSRDHAHVFSAQDLETAVAQASGDGNLTNGARQLCHVVSVDTIMRMIEG